MRFWNSLIIIGFWLALLFALALPIVLFYWIAGWVGALVAVVILAFIALVHSLD